MAPEIADNGQGGERGTMSPFLNCQRLLNPRYLRFSRVLEEKGTQASMAQSTGPDLDLGSPGTPTPSACNPSDPAP